MCGLTAVSYTHLDVYKRQTWDPKEVWTFVVWCVYAAYMHARATAGWEHKKATIISLVGYAAIIVNFAVVNIYFVGKHSYSGK